MSDLQELEARLEPLKRLLATGQVVRVVARPGWVTVDRPGEIARVDVGWDEESHRDVLAALAAPEVLEGGVTAVATAGAVVLRRPPDPLRRIEDLAAEGWLSSMAARLLHHAVELGRNVMLVGPWPVCVEIIGSLLAAAARPCVVGRPGDAVPTGWLLVNDAEQVSTVGADRSGAWSLEADELGRLMSRRSAVIGWLDALRLERALMRFEAGASGPAGAGAPLAVLTAVDLIVVAAPAGEPRVRTIAEIVLGEDGYQPRLLFARGRPPVPSALVPVGAPSFLNDLADAGHGVLVDELRHAVGEDAQASQPQAVPSAPEPVWQPEPAAVQPAPASAPGPIIERGVASVAGEPLPDPALADAPPPGWELDQIPEEELEQEVGSGSADDAAMAATFGLAPPPRPASVRGEGTFSDNTGTFQDALTRARERDEQMRRELEDEEDSDDDYLGSGGPHS